MINNKYYDNSLILDAAELKITFQKKTLSLSNTKNGSILVVLVT